MKQVTIALAALLLSLAGLAQAPANPYPKTITVTGSAEMEVTPDEIWATVTLREYERKGASKVTLSTIKDAFLRSARAVGIADSSITIAAYDGSNGNPWLRKKNKKEELLASITYQVKIGSSAQMDALVDRLDDNATQNFAIERTSHSHMEAFRRQLRINAVIAAKDKAQYLAEAIGEKAGVAVTINEPTEFFSPIFMRTSNTMMKSEAASDEGSPAQPDFRKMKIRYEVTVVFALK
ncbi:MAG: hypothetical protein JWP27_2330 [Flaviaesturariibacter sp.]|nr:hypothetical protein [Flaviaesturariibacter sp.]